MKKYFTLIFCFLFISIYAQTKKDDVYFVLNTNHKDYVIVADGDEINEIKKPLNINMFYLYNKSQYLEREKQIEIDKKEGNFIGYQFYKRPKELVFDVVDGSAETLSKCDRLSLKIVDYKWVKMNTWKEGNTNILFKDLYFLFEVKKDKFIKYKVKRTVIAY